MLAPGYGWPLGERTWINPSPNAPNLWMARCYAGTVLLEGTTLSEGRGTTRPLELFGAPDIDARTCNQQNARSCSRLGWPVAGCASAGLNRHFINMPENYAPACKSMWKTTLINIMRFDPGDCRLWHLKRCVINSRIIRCGVISLMNTNWTGWLLM